MSRTVNKLNRRSLWFLPLLLLIAAPLPFDNPLVVPILSQIGIAVVFALSYNILLGQTGLLSLGHALFFGFGGFAAVHALRYAASGGFPVPLPIIPVFGALGGFTLAVLLGSFTAKRVGMAFAIITICVVELVLASAILFGRFYGGSADRTLAPAFFGQDFSSDLAVYYLILIWVVIAAGAMAWYARSPLGRMANAVRDNGARVDFLGFNARAIRFASFAAAGFFAGIAGSLFAIAYEFVGGETISLALSRDVVVMAYIGGIGHFAGPIIGAVVFTLLQSLLSNFTNIWGLYVGLVFMGAVLFAPGGLAGAINAHLPLIARRRVGGLARPYGTVSGGALAASIGLIGLLEMISFRNEAAVNETVARIFSLSFDTAEPASWLGFSALLAVGLMVLKHSLPLARSAFLERSVIRLKHTRSF